MEPIDFTPLLVALVVVGAIVGFLVATLIWALV